LKLAIYINETLIAELSDDETEEIFLEWIEDNCPEHQPSSADDYIQVIPTDY
jgi:hypothetical protein|tara:strand:- start:220 stop:375 length:156 start_codon:yes stop_codon:yes gene_type:complete